MRWWRRKDREYDLEREIRSDLELEAEEQQENGSGRKTRGLGLGGRLGIQHW
jgi:hypothetical protein